MKNSKLLFAALIAAVFASSSFGAIYLKIEGIKGESTDSAHEGWIDVEAISGLPSAREKGSGMATGKRTHKPISIRKRVDKSSPLLAKALDKSSTGVIKALDKSSTRKALDKSNPGAIKALDKSSTRIMKAPSSGKSEAQKASMGAAYTTNLTLSIDGVIHELGGAKVKSSERSGDFETLVISFESLRTSGGDKGWQSLGIRTNTREHQYKQGR